MNEPTKIYLVKVDADFKAESAWWVNLKAFVSKAMAEEYAEKEGGYIDEVELVAEQVAASVRG